MSDDLISFDEKKKQWTMDEIAEYVAELALEKVLAKLDKLNHGSAYSKKVDNE